MKLPDSTRMICMMPARLGLGGPASFQARLAAGLKARGVEVSFDPRNPINRAILVIGGTKNLADLGRAKRSGVRVVQRLNGMNWVHRRRFTGIKHFLRAEINNYILAAIRRKYAEGIVYQSNFSQQWWNDWRGQIQKESSVIYNGVDLEQYCPVSGELPPNDMYRVIVVEGHHGGGYDQGLLTAVKVVKLLNERMDRRVELRVVGDVPHGLKAACAQSGVLIDWIGVVKRSEVPALDRTSHVLFSTDINAACPNAVVEALACGLPVVSYDTGALPEMVTESAGRIVKYGGNPWKLDPPDVYALADGIAQVLTSQREFREGARARAEEAFGIDQMVEKYLEFLWR